MFEYLENLDRELFLFINQHNFSFFDFLMPWYTFKYTWIPLYIILIILLYKKYGVKALYVIFPLIILAAGLSDATCNLFKYGIARYRPCQNTEIGHLVKLYAKIGHTKLHCGDKYGFVSAHSSTSFAIALLFTLFYKNKIATILIFSWAGIMAYSRIYVGVHYPADVIIGAINGLMCGFILYFIYRYILNRIAFFRLNDSFIKKLTKK